MKTIGITASEEKSLENVDDGQMEGRRIPVYTINSPMSLQLRRANKRILESEIIFKCPVKILPAG